MSIKSMDHELDDTFLTINVMITTGISTHLNGEEEVRGHVAGLEENLCYLRIHNYNKLLL